VRTRHVVLLALAACTVTAVGPVASGAAQSARGTLDRAMADRPDEVGGPQVHAIYVLPSDAPDKALDTNGTIASWINTFNGWFAGQAGGARVRMDIFQGSPDVSFLRLAETDDQLTASGSDTEATIGKALAANGFADRYKIYLVVSPGHSDGYCGVSTGALAILYLGMCDGVSWPSVMAHEVIHSLGAVPGCAPHHADNGHVDDSDRDIMWPYAGLPLTSQVLDAGHDDYYGPPGDNHLDADCPNIADSEFLTTTRFFRLVVTSDGNGEAFASPLSAGDRCDAATPCSYFVRAGQRVMMGAQARAGFHFVGWSGGGCSTDESCILNVGADTTVKALFAPDPKLALVIRGKGRVEIPDFMTTCSRICTFQLAYDIESELAAHPAKGWRFDSWSGACSGKRLVCNVRLTADATQVATFKKILPKCRKGQKSTAARRCRR
jgi:hypothetical protein